MADLTLYRVGATDVFWISGVALRRLRSGTYKETDFVTFVRFKLSEMPKFVEQESKYWVGTHHATGNVKGLYEPEWPSELKTYGKHEVTYSIGQEELGAKTNVGKYHLQFYVEFKSKVKLSVLTKGKTFSKRIHWERRKGTGEQARDYCCKEDTRVAAGISWVVGAMLESKQGSRTDIANMTDMVLSGKKRKEIALANPTAYTKYSRGLEAFADAVDLSLDDDVSVWHKRKCYILYGAAGSGKTLFAKYIMRGDSYFLPQQNNAGQYSFEGYQKEKWIFLDEFAPKCMTAEQLKAIMDTGRCKLPARGTGNSRPGMHSGVVITSNLDPEKWYEAKVHWDAIARRCQQVVECGNPLALDPLTDPWMIIGGTELPRGETFPSPLQEMIAWAKEEENKELQEQQAQDPQDVETEDEVE